MGKLIAVYTEVFNERPYRLAVGSEDLLVDEMETLATVPNDAGFTPNFVAKLEDLLLSRGYAVTSAWKDETDFWFASVVTTR